jgi:hypothetical protein
MMPSDWETAAGIGNADFLTAEAARNAMLRGFAFEGQEDCL